MFDVICHLTGDRAEAETADAALLAADTLAHDHADHAGTRGSLDAARREMTILENGTRDGVLTSLAQRGWRR